MKTITVDPQFSAYALIDRLNIYNIFSERRKMLAYWSKTIEDTVVDFKLEADIYAGFQQLHHLMPVLPRYQKMAAAARKIWIFGEIDTSFPPLNNTHFIGLTQSDLLIREWFVVVNHRSYSRALVAQEISEPGLPNKQRMFRGIMTTDRRIVDKVHQAFDEALGSTK